MDDKFIQIPNYDKQNYPFFKLKLLVIIQLFKTEEKWPIFLSQRMRKLWIKVKLTIPCPLPPPLRKVDWMSKNYVFKNLSKFNKEAKKQEKLCS